MAATDKFYRDQNKLDMVFAISSVLMLVSVILMFAQDYFREFKDEQRVFRDVEQTIAQRVALEQLQIADAEKIDVAQDAVKAAYDERKAQEGKVADLRKEILGLLPSKERLEAKVGDIKANEESILSKYYIAVEEHGLTSTEAGLFKAQHEKLSRDLFEATAARDEAAAKVSVKQREVDAIEADLTGKLGQLKKLHDKFDSAAKLAVTKEWGWGDFIRSLPVIDGFASPTKIQQITNNDYPINYNFKDATRFDRCTTCHLGIDRPHYTPERLASLVKSSPKDEEVLAEAQAALRKRKATLAGLPDAALVPDPSQLKLTTISDKRLTEARIRQFAAHPRLDLFVGSDSKHPMEKFGCSSCHNGQGSSTTFHWASHTPNDAKQEQRWHNDLGWSHIHAGDWELPMYSKRFAESACLKCHHQVTDLISAENRNEAPKLLRGYNLIRENGCFGCHEIQGRKAGRSVGPDLRIESTPPLDDLTPTEREKIESDLDNRPGNLRKVGPSLYRLAEKSNHDFMAKWIKAPREFRPDTKMPHFYGLSNNDPSRLPDEQKQFPDAEVQAVTYYLFNASKTFLGDVGSLRKSDGADAARKDSETIVGLVAKSKLSDTEKKALEEAQRRVRLRKATSLKDLTGGYAGDAKKGRHLFVERGCLACHSHQATEQKDGDSPAIVGEAQFGPNLSQLVEKIGKSDAARTWLVQWLIDPKVHSPRTRMPSTHLGEKEAADLAAWLLAQEPKDLGPGWNKLNVAAADVATLEQLAEVYLVRNVVKADLKKFFETKELDETIAKTLPADDRQFVETYAKGGEHAIKMYVGKKGVGRQGCYACHDIPGFDSAKPIGVALADWGKKDGSKLAFEDVGAYIRENHYVVDSLLDENGVAHTPRTGKDGKTQTPYEKFFVDGLEHHFRESYLHQKLMEPRSYDHNRMRAWDDRSRMPQFRFARSKKKAGESDAEFAGRSLKAESEAREAVMTFVLGLVGEAVPEKVVNRPSPDRLAEIKGRQVLDNFNCSGCHLVRAGSFEIKIDEKLREFWTKVAKLNRSGEHAFPNHRFWSGKAPERADRVRIQGILPQPALSEEEDEERKILLRLTSAVRFADDENALRDIPAATTLPLEARHFASPEPAVFESREKLTAYLKDRGQYGGTFADALVGYLHRKDPKKYDRDPGVGDSSKARPLVPPSLLGFGEKAKSDWAYAFLRNPQPVRKMTVLRMPNFNLSESEARALVDYFAALERQQNPGLGLSYPFEATPPANDESYWQRKSSDYVARLKATKVSTGGKESTMFDKRVADLTPIWQATLKDYEGQKAAAQSRVDAAAAKYKTAASDEEAAKKALDAAKKDKKGDVEKLDTAHKAAKATLDEATRVKDAWDREMVGLTQKVADHALDAQKKTWMERDAYLSDGFKLVANKALCIQCHSMGPIETKNEVLGPRLDEVGGRLRAGWLERWIANPTRHLPYSTSMPPYFAADKATEFQEFFVGTPAERVQAVRDVLSAYPQASALPANRHWLLPIPGDVK